jgi:hypothetical protein
MARGVPSEPVPYVLEADRGLPNEEQTVFHIKPKTGNDSNYITKLYISAYIEKDGGARDLDVRQANAADVATFKHLVKKIENYCFSDEYYEKHPAVKEKAVEVKSENEVLKYVPVIDSPDMIADVCHDVDSDSLREIISVANNLNKLKDGQKK